MATGSPERAPWSLAPKQLLWKLSDKARHFQEKRTLTPEVDIIARDGDITAFIEVKSRRSAEGGSPDRQIDETKRCNMTRAARAYAARAGIAWNQVRFDVISVVFTQPPSIVHQQDAFFEGRSM